MLNNLVNQGPYAALFVWLLYTTRKESAERETRLMEHLDRTSETLNEISDSLRDLKQEVDGIKEKMGD